MMSFTERRAWLVGAISMILIGAGVALAFSLPKFQALRGVYTVSAELKDAAGLQNGNEVRVAGVKVGTVKSIRLTDTAAQVEMEIEDGIDLPLETQLEVKLKTLLGQKFIDVQFPSLFLKSVASGREPVTAGYFQEGDVIPLEQTRVPFEIHQAATEGTNALKRIDKQALRKMLDVLAQTVGESKEELRAALQGLDAAGRVLAPKGPEITTLLRNLDSVAGTLSESGSDIDKILTRATSALGTLSDRRKELSAILAATNDFSKNFALLLRAVRAPIDVGTADLDTVLLTLEGELDTIGRVLEELPVAQKMFAQPLQFGRFVESHVCAVTTEDTCVPRGTPTSPGLPSKGTQPLPGEDALRGVTP